MRLHNNKASIKTWFLFLFLLFLVLLIIPKDFALSGKSNFNQYLMTFDPGFSSVENIANKGQSSNRAVHAIKLFNKVAGYKINPVTLPRIDIDIDFNSYQLLLKDRKTAIKNNILTNPSKVPATIRYKNNKYKAKVRLKGDLNDHWKSKHRISIKVQLKNNKTILGLSEFSVQKPIARQFPYDHVFQLLQRDIGGMSPLNLYARVYINGSSMGVMNIEEGISKEFIEKQKNKESAVIKFSNEDIWLFNERMSKDKYQHYRLSDPSLYLKMYSQNKYLKKMHYRKALSYISSMHKDMDIRIYNIDSFSKTYLLAFLWDFHSLKNSNARYYFNPYTLKLEPVTTDQTKVRKINSNIDMTFYNKMYCTIINSDKFKDNLYNNFTTVEDALKNTNKYFDSANLLFPVNSKKNDKNIKINIEKIKNSIHSVYLNNKCKSNKTHKITEPTENQAKNLMDLIHLRHYSDGNIEISNLIPDNVKVTEIIFNGINLIDQDLNIPSYLDSKSVVIKTNYKGIFDNKFVASSFYKGEARRTRSGVTLIKDVVNPLLTNTVDKFDFIDRVNGAQYEINPGNWTADSPIIIDGDLHIKPGANIRFSKNSYLIVKGSLNAVGTEESPIVLDSKIDLWKGVYVINSNKDSYLNNVSFNNMSALEDGLLSLTGSVNFYKSNVTLENVKFNNIKAEDAINFVKSDFRMNSVVIKNAISDGLDSDFSNGEIHNSKFFDIGGDALDFSGSSIDIDAVIVENTKDKAISAGEGSDVYLTNSKFNKIGIGIASKDGSKVSASNVDISNYKLNGIMTYIKKDFYGVPSLKLNNSKITNGNKYLRQSGTLLTVDGLNVPETRVNVKKLYKQGVMLK